MKSNENAYRKKVLRIMSAYAFVMLTILILSVAELRGDRNTVYDTQVDTKSAEKEYVYVTQDIPSYAIPDDSENTENMEERYIIREYMYRIGVFSYDGSLIRVIEVYTKTLPEADKRLLREGIEIQGKQELNAIIEDYTG